MVLLGCSFGFASLIGGGGAGEESFATFLMPRCAELLISAAARPAALASARAPSEPRSCCGGGGWGGLVLRPSRSAVLLHQIEARCSSLSTCGVGTLVEGFGKSQNGALDVPASLHIIPFISNATEFSSATTAEMRHTATLYLHHPIMTQKVCPDSLDLPTDLDYKGMRRCALVGSGRKSRVKRSLVATKGFATLLSCSVPKSAF